MSIRATRITTLRTALPVASSRALGIAQAWLWWRNISPAAANLHLG